MTREEAVNELNDRIKSAEYVDSDYIDCVSVDAVKMAISALSVPETNVGDTISRQAAIDALVKRTHLDWEYLKIIHPMLDVFEQLTSAEPERKTGKWILQDTSYWRSTHAGDVQINRVNLKCSICGWRNYEKKYYNFCPNCGKKMEGDSE